MPVGHSPEGKEGERTTAIGLARKGFVVLKYDPIGQGERLQYYDPDLRTSKVGPTTQEHSHANGHAVLIGDNVARYRVWDGIRGIDYLLTRKDVAPKRIGVTGCSGGGDAYDLYRGARHARAGGGARLLHHLLGATAGQPRATGW
jgi:hypothetical protein